MKKTALALIIAVVLSGCSASAEAEKGNYIIAKEEQRILVAKDISWQDVEGETMDTLRKKKVELVNYIVEDSQLYDELQVGEEVNVTPKTDDKGQYVVMQSDPVQIVAGKIEREQDSAAAFDEAKAVELVLKDHPDFPKAGESKKIETTTGGPPPGAKVSGELKTTVEKTTDPSAFIVTLTKAWHVTVNGKEAKCVWKYKVTPDKVELVSRDENADLINTIK